MNHKALFAAALLPLLASTAWSADCTYPRAPAKLPDGNVATIDEMKAAKTEVEAYNKTMDSYLECIKVAYDEDIAKQGSTLTEEQKAQRATVHDQKNRAASDEVQAVAAKFNEQVRAYRSKHPPK
ncbi:MAG: hypothetical protein EOP08_06210 [Proteobacteria bacterium]|nr:MAG: hypothetical protein EOP08_06210 [Pseudomonadota bacterium]